MRNFVLACSLLFCASVLHAAEEAEIKKLLPGVWVASIDKDGVKLDGVTEYKADGTFTAKAKVSLPGGQGLDMAVEGTWVVKGSKVASTLTKSSHPEALKLGEQPEEEILEITDKMRKYKNAKGEEFSETRKN